MNKDIVELSEDVSASPLYSEDLAPVKASGRTWSVWSLAALWVGMAVCIPTYMLASNFIVNGISWLWALVIIGLANIIITIPMVLSGHSGVKYGVPFPVVGRSAFGHNGIHIPAIVRGLIAAVWFGIQTWIGGISVYSIYMAITGGTMSADLSAGKFVGFFVFWLLNVYFIYKGTESIKWLEMLAAPLLLLMGIALIAWGSMQAGSFTRVLDSSVQLEKVTATYQVTAEKTYSLQLSPVRDSDGSIKAKEIAISLPLVGSEKRHLLGWQPFASQVTISPENLAGINIDTGALKAGQRSIEVSFRAGETSSKPVPAVLSSGTSTETGIDLWPYMIMLTAMVGFWATMSISIADITRYAKTQSDQVKGQFLGLPGAMVLYSFVGIFVTVAAVLVFDDILVREDAPWDPSSLLAKFQDPTVVIISQVFMLIATLSTNIAANVIAPANAFANAFPRHISFRTGGIITAVIGIIIMPWYIINHIVPFLLFVSSLLGPVVAILICDYFIIRKTQLNLADLFKVDGEYSFGGSGFNRAAMVAFTIGVIVAGIGNFVSALSWLHDISWFSGFMVTFILYYLLMKGKVKAV